MSRNGQPGDGPSPDARTGGAQAVPDTAIFIGHFAMPRGTAFATHWHVFHQLAWSARGLLRIRSEQGTWLLPPSLALWIPAGLRHATESVGDAVMRSAYVDPGQSQKIEWPEPTVVSAGPCSAHSSTIWPATTLPRAPVHGRRPYCSTYCTRSP